MATLVILLSIISSLLQIAWQNCDLQCTTRRVNSRLDLFKTFTSMNIARDPHNRIIDRFIEPQRQSPRFICMFIRMTSLFHKVIALQITKAPFRNLTRPSLDAFLPFGLISRVCPAITNKQSPIFATIWKMWYLSITNSFAHITRGAHAYFCSSYCRNGSKNCRL